MDYFNLITYEEYLKILNSIEVPKLKKINLPLDESYNRFCYSDIESPSDLPGFSRSQVDGYAVKAEDTFSAASSPVYLNVKGTLRVDENASEYRISNGECFRISTGGMIPEGADSVVMIEHTNPLGNGIVEIVKPVSPLENVIRYDEDVKRGELVVKRGQMLKTPQIGLLASLGVENVDVFEKISIGIISTGDELVDSRSPLLPGKIRDVNSHTLAALCIRYGAAPKLYGIAKDNENEIKAMLEKSLSSNQITLISGGSSVGTRDLTLKVIGDFSDSKIIFHGIGIKPGKPTILSTVRDRFIFGLPGQVMSSIVSFLATVQPLIGQFYGNGESLKYFKVIAGTNIKSTLGRKEWINCKIVSSNESSNSQYQAMPVYSKSGVIGPLLKGDGFIIVDENREGVKKGELVDFIYHSYTM